MTLIPVAVRAPDYVQGGTRLPGLSVSGSRDDAGKLHLTVVKLGPARASDLRIAVTGRTVRASRGTVLTAERINTSIRFDAPDAFVPKTLATRNAGGRIVARLPPKFVSLIEIE